MRLLPKSIHWCRRYPTKFNSGRDIPGSADGAPTRWTYTVVEELSARLAEHVKQLNALVDSDLTAFLK